MGWSVDTETGWSVGSETPGQLTLKQGGQFRVKRGGQLGVKYSKDTLSIKKQIHFLNSSPEKTLSFERRFIPFE